MMRDLRVADVYELLGVTKQAWYEYHRQTFEDALDEDLIVECVRSIREDMPACGGRKIKELLRSEFSLDVGRDNLFEILERHNLLIKPRRRKTRTTISDHDLTVYPDLRKEFEPDGINSLWVSDIIYIWLGDCFWYLFLITDAYSRKIVGWEVADNMRHENAGDGTENGTQTAEERDENYPPFRQGACNTVPGNTLRCLPQEESASACPRDMIRATMVSPNVSMVFPKRNF